MTQKIRYILRLIGTFFSRFKLVILISAFVGLIFSITVILIKPSFLSASRQRIGVIGMYTFENLSPDILDMVGDGLTQIDEKGIVQPNLAESWKSEDNGKVWTFTLKEDLEWQDGKKVDSSDINYSFTDISIEKPDKKTIIFKLSDSFSPFPYVVSKPTFKKGLLGTGEWKVTKASTVGNYIQELILKDKTGNRITYKFYPTEEKAKNAFKLGQVDILQNLINSSPFNNWPNTFVKETTDQESIVAIFFNTEDKYLSEKSLRQSLAYAIDKDSLNGFRAISPISPNSWAFNPQIKEYNYSKQRASELLTDLPKEVREQINIKLETTPALLSIAEKVVADWKDFGINAFVHATPSIPNEYQAVLVIFKTPKDPDQYFLWHSTQTNSNISKYKDVRIDKLLEDGRQELNQQNRKKIYWDFQRFLVEDSPAIFLYHPTFYDIYRK